MAWKGGNVWKSDWWLAGWGGGCGGGGHAHAMKCSFFSWLLGCGMCCILRGRLSKCDSTLASSLPEQIACQHTHTYSHTLTHLHSHTYAHTRTHTHVACRRNERVGQLRPRAIAPSLSSPFRCQLSLMYPARSGHASCLWPAFCVFVFVQRKMFRSAPDWLDMTAGMCGRRFQESQDRYVA